MRRLLDPGDRWDRARAGGAERRVLREVSPWEFFTGTEWAPLKNAKFGVLPLLSGTLVVTLIAAMICLPLGLLAAIYLSEYAARRTRSFVKPILEILAGIPTVVYGFFALTFITPLLRDNWLFGSPPGVFNALSAGLVMGIMILPTVASISEDAMHAVPQSLRAGAAALGATKYEISTRVVVPAGLSGIIAAFVLGISRAIGETMISCSLPRAAHRTSRSTRSRPCRP